VTDIDYHSYDYELVPKNKRRIIDPLCRSLANLRHHNQNHPLRQLRLWSPDGVHNVKPFLFTAKQFGIHHLIESPLSTYSLVEFCRGNTFLKNFEIFSLTVLDEGPTISERSMWHRIPHLFRP
jgi:hypothetical protein